MASQRSFPSLTQGQECVEGVATHMHALGQCCQEGFILQGTWVQASLHHGPALDLGLPPPPLSLGLSSLHGQTGARTVTL